MMSIIDKISDALAKSQEIKGILDPKQIENIETTNQDTFDNAVKVFGHYFHFCFKNENTGDTNETQRPSPRVILTLKKKSGKCDVTVDENTTLPVRGAAQVTANLIETQRQLDETTKSIIDLVGKGADKNLLKKAGLHLRSEFKHFFPEEIKRIEMLKSLSNYDLNIHQMLRRQYIPGYNTAKEIRAPKSFRPGDLTYFDAKTAVHLQAEIINPNVLDDIEKSINFGRKNGKNCFLRQINDEVEKRYPSQHIVVMSKFDYIKNGVTDDFLLDAYLDFSIQSIEKSNIDIKVLVVVVDTVNISADIVNDKDIIEIANNALDNVINTDLTENEIESKGLKNFSLTIKIENDPLIITQLDVERIERFKKEFLTPVDEPEQWKTIRGENGQFYKLPQTCGLDDRVLERTLVTHDVAHAEKIIENLKSMSGLERKINQVVIGQNLETGEIRKGFFNTAVQVQAEIVNPGLKTHTQTPKQIHDQSQHDHFCALLKKELSKNNNNGRSFHCLNKQRFVYNGEFFKAYEELVHENTGFPVPLVPVPGYIIADAMIDLHTRFLSGERNPCQIIRFYYIDKELMKLDSNIENIAKLAMSNPIDHSSIEIERVWESDGQTHSRILPEFRILGEEGELQKIFDTLPDAGNFEYTVNYHQIAHYFPEMVPNLSKISRFKDNYLKPVDVFFKGETTLSKSGERFVAPKIALRSKSKQSIDRVDSKIINFSKESGYNPDLEKIDSEIESLRKEMAELEKDLPNNVLNLSYEKMIEKFNLNSRLVCVNANRAQRS